MRLLANPAHSLLLSLSSGYALFYFSELVFWARPRPEDSLANWAATWLAYSLMAFLFLALIQYFHVHSLPALFLCGAFFGWLAEGVIVQTAYENLPLSLSFTGLAWHALITILAGWYGLQMALRSGFWRALGASFFTGMFVWFWGICWIYEEPLTAAAPELFAGYILAATLLLAASFLLNARLFARPFQPPRLAVLLIAGLVAVYFALVAVPAAPVAALILPVLMCVLYLGLRRNRGQYSQGSLLENLSRPIPARNLLSLLLIPLTAGALYWLYWHSGLKLPTNWILYFVSTPAGFALLGWSLWKIWRGEPASLQVMPTAPGEMPPQTG